MTTPTASPPSLVPSTAADLAVVQRLANTIWREYYPSIISHEQIDYMLARGYAVEALRKYLREPGAGLVILHAGGGPAGFVAWARTTEPATTKLDKLYVLASARGTGCGRRLVEHVEAAARRDGARTLVLNVNKHNVKAIAVYRACGYAVRESVIVDIGGGFVMDDYVMAKALQASGLPGRAG